MALAEQRAEVLGKYLTDDSERAQKLLKMPPEEATKAINADGNDFAVEEVEEFGKQLQIVFANQTEGELDAEALSNVSGGFVVSSVVVTAGVSLFIAGVTFGGVIGANLREKGIVW